MNRLTIFVATIALAACSTTPESPARAPAPVPAPGPTKDASPSHFDFSDLPEQELRLDQLLKECQTRTGFNFTYAATTGAVIEKSFVRFSRSPAMTPAEFETALQEALLVHGLEAKRIGPDHLQVYAIQLRKS
jgi:hypothetical protein